MDVLRPIGFASVSDIALAFLIGQIVSSPLLPRWPVAPPSLIPRTPRLSLAESAYTGHAVINDSVEVFVDD